jgi:hypothetical protein
VKKYKVMIEGANFLIELDDATTKHGFFTTRFVEAEDEEAAENQAIEITRMELANRVKNDRDDSPVMFVEEMVEIGPFEEFPVPRPGFVWFPDEKGH